MVKVRLRGPSPQRGKGRPKGSAVPLLRDPDRFDVAMAIAVQEASGWSFYRSSDLVQFLRAADEPEVSKVEDLIKASVRPGHVVAEHRTETIVRKAKRAANIPEDLAWISTSVACLLIVIWELMPALRRPGSSPTVPAAIARQTLFELDRWAEYLRPIAARLARISRSNFPPEEDGAE